MKKQKTVVFALLISLLSISAFQLLSANLASASVGAANFLPDCYIPPPNGPDTANEVTLSRSVAQYVTTTLANFNSPYGCYYSYDTDCTVSRYDSILSTLQTYYDQSIVFSKGHRGVPYLPGNSNHFSLLDNTGNNVIDATDIYSRTSSKNTFTFIWHCQTALHYTTGTIPWDYPYGYYGMPYCWTHNQNMNRYGTSGSQVFLGWTDQVPPPPYPEQRGGSPQYEWWITPNTYNYANVAGMFWYYMCNGDTVAQTLNQIALTIYGQYSFYNTNLNGWLVVWGNTGLQLP